MKDEFCLFEVNQKRVIWEVTNYCNYQCKHCCASAKKIDTKEELSTNRFLSVLDELSDFGVKEIYFSGGEPFSRDDILTILEKATNNGIICNISTNGSYLTPAIAKKLKALNLNKIHISLDSNEENIFNKFRGGNYFTPTVNAIKLLKQNRLYVRVGTVIWKENIEKIEDMITYLINLGVDEVVFNWLVKVGRLLENTDVCVPLSEFDKTVNKICEYTEKYKEKIKISMHRKETFCNTSKICPAGETFFYINPQGYVSPCSWIKKMDSSYTTKKSLKDTSFLEIIQENEIKAFIGLKQKRHELFGAGCPAICMERNKTYFSQDPLLVKRKEAILV